MSNRTMALFAAGDVGCDVARFIGKNDEQLACLVLDSNDTKKHRGKICQSANLRNSTPVFQSDELDDQFVRNKMDSLNIDLGVLAWWPYIIDEGLINIANDGFLNFHPSYLPYNRGKDPNFWAIVDETPFGVTIHWVSPEVDCGDIAYRRRIDKSWEDTGKTLYNKAQYEIVDLFESNYEEIKKGTIPKIPQNNSTATYHERKELSSASNINLEQMYTAKELLNILRAKTFPPHQGAWFLHQGDKYEIQVDITKSTEN